jgi:hypothetical protein
MKPVRIVVFLMGLVVSAWLASLSSSLVVAHFASKNERGSYIIDTLGALTALIAYLAVLALVIMLLVKVVYVGRPVDRIFFILAGYVGAAFGAGLLLTLELWLAGLLVPDSPNSVMIILPGTLVAGTYIALFALVPTVLVMAYTEFWRMQSALFYGAAGMVVAVLGYALYVLLLIEPDFGSRILLGGLPFVALPGLAGGLIYWSIAGRNAGGAEIASGEAAPIAG